MAELSIKVYFFKKKLFSEIIWLLLQLLLVVSRLDVKPATRVLYLPTCVCSFVHNL